MASEIELMRQQIINTLEVRLRFLQNEEASIERTLDLLHNNRDFDNIVAVILRSAATIDKERLETVQVR
jgi:hypothetical protein